MADEYAGLDAAVGGIVDQRASVVRNNVANAAGSNPATEAEYSHLARFTGMPIDTVRALPDDARQQAAVQNADADSLVTDYPHVARFLSDPYQATVAQKDVGYLKDIERGMKGAQFAPERDSIVEGLWHAGQYSAWQMWQGLKLQFYDLQHHGNPYADLTDLRIQQTKRDIAFGQKAQAETAPEIDSTPGKLAYGAGEALSSTVPQLLAALLNPTLGAAAFGATGDASAYGRFRARGGKPAESTAGAAAQGTIDAATNYLPFRYISDKLGKAGAGEFLAKLLGIDLASMEVQTVASKVVDTSVANPDKTWAQAAGELPGEMGQAAVNALAFAGVMHPIHVLAGRMSREDVAIQQSQNAADTLNLLSRIGTATELRKHDPEAFANFVADVTENTPMQDVYVDAVKFSDALQQSGVSEADLAKSLPNIAERLQTAREHGGDVRIPVADYAAHIAGGPLDAALLQHVKPSPDGLTFNETQEAIQTQAERLRAEAEKTVEDKQQRDLWRESSATVESELLKQLEGVNRFSGDVNRVYAKLAASLIDVAAARGGRTPEEQYVKYPLDIVAMWGKTGRGFDQTPGDAERLGFDTSERWLHGTRADIKAFRPGKGGVNELGTGVYLTKSPLYANAWAKGEGANILPVYIRKGDLYDLGAHRRKIGLADGNKLYEDIARRIQSHPGRMPEIAKGWVDHPPEGFAEHIKDSIKRGGDLNTWLDRAGYIGAFDSNSQIPDQVVVFNPKNIRSVNAKFAKDNTAKLLAQEANPRGASNTHVMFEVAPDPHDTELSARWNTLPDHVKQEISLDVAHEVIPEVLKVVGAEGDIRPQIGGYLDDTNPSFALVLAEGVDAAKVVEATKLAGFALSQDSMMTVSEHPFEGGEKVGALKIELPAHADFSLVRGVYDKLREIEVAGQKPIGGHTTVDGQMSILNYSEVPIEELARLVDERLGSAYTIKIDDVFAWFPGKEEYSYASDRQPRQADGRQPPVQGDADRLRGEASRAIVDALDRYEGRTGDTEPHPQTRDGGLKQQDGQRPARGKIAFGDDITREPTTIALLQNADLSTFVHELGHFNLQVMAHMAAEADAAPEIKQDVDTLMHWFGVPDLAAWNAMSLDQQRPHHEQFARGFEAYLFEGKSPSLEMQSIFSRVRAWMIHVYKQLSNLNVQLTDEVRGVFDRMIASAEQIKAAQEARGMMPLFETTPEGMPADAWAQYQKDTQDATETALAQHQSRTLRDLKWMSNARSKAIRDLQRQASAQRRIITSEAEQTIAAEPVYKAEEWLLHGRTIDSEGNEVEIAKEARQGAKLSREAVDEMFPPGDPTRPDLTLLRGMTSDEGLPPDVVADMFGFKSGRELVNALLGRTPRREAVKGLTDSMMLERHGEMSDPDSIARSADAAIHNELRARVIANEWRTLARIQGAPGALAKAAKQAAEETVAARRIRDVKPKEYEAAESRFAREADKAMKAGDLEAAARAKRMQLVNNRLAKAALDALDDIDKSMARFKRIDKKAAQANMRGEFLDQLNTLLGRFDLRTSVAPDTSRVPLRDWIASEADRLAAVMPDIPEWVLNEQFRTHYKNLTVEEMRGLADTVKQLEFMARREQKQYLAIRAMEFAAERKEVIDAIRENWKDAFDADGEPLPPEPDFVPSIKKAAGKLGDKFVGEFLSPETIYSILGGGKFGIIHESLFGRMSKRSDWKAQRLEGLYSELKPLFKAYNAIEKFQFSRKDIGTGTPADLPLTRENALVVALLHGNPEGRERLSNYGWSETRQQQIIALLDAKDIALANAIWKTFDENLWPELKALNDRTRGKAPPKVVALPYETAHGTARGGYFRLKYDTELDERAHHLDEGQAVKELLGGGMGMSAKTNQGTSTERKSNVTMRPRLDLGVFSEAVNETVHDLAYREAVADTIRMLNDKGIMHAVKNVVGTPGYRALVQRVREVAAPPRNPSGFLEKTLSIARRNTVINLMSGVKTALQNFTGIAPAFAEVNAGDMAQEIARFYSPKMKERYAFVMEHSEYMNRRFTSYDRDLANEVGKLTMNGRLLPETSTFLALMGLVDKGVAVPIWNAAFKQGMGRFENDTAKAIDYADHVVRQTQGSGREVDLPNIMAGHGGMGQLKRVFTMFYSYFNGQLNLLVKHGVVSAIEARDNPALAAASFAAKFVAIIAVPTILTEMLMNGVVQDDEKNNPDKWLLRMAGAFVRYGAGFFPLVRDLVPGIWTQLTGDGHYFGTKVSPIDSAMGAMVAAAKSTKDVTTGRADEKDTKNLIMAAGYMTGTPGKLVADTVDGTRAWLDDKAGPEAIVLGPPRK